MPSTAAEPLHIAVGIISNDEGRVLVSERRQGTHGAGLWEFPGGKLEAGEALIDGLRRELNEELGIKVIEAVPLIVISHQYPDRSVVLDTWQVRSYRGTPTAREGQQLVWLRRSELFDWPLLPADRPIVNALNLPSLYLITGEFGDISQFVARLRASLDAGIRLLRFRAPQIDDDEYESLAVVAQSICEPVGARLILDRHADMVERVGASGLHLTQSALMQHACRPVDRSYLLLASCHDRESVLRATAINCDAVVVSPVLDNPSDAQRSLLGWPGFSDLTSTSNLPVYALGGMRADDIEPVRAAGGHGIAAVRSLWEQDRD